MGRRKIEIQPITHDRNRSVTFLKRKNGLFKKAYELGVLTSCDVLVIVFGQNQKLYEYSSAPHGNANRILDRRLNFTGDRETKGPADYGEGGKDDDELDGEDDEEDALPSSRRGGGGDPGGSAALAAASTTGGRPHSSSHATRGRSSGVYDVSDAPMGSTRDDSQPDRSGRSHPSRYQQQPSFPSSEEPRGLPSHRQEFDGPQQQHPSEQSFVGPSTLPPYANGSHGNPSYNPATLNAAALQASLAQLISSNPYLASQFNAIQGGFSALNAANPTFGLSGFSNPSGPNLSSSPGLHPLYANPLFSSILSHSQQQQLQQQQQSPVRLPLPTPASAAPFHFPNHDASQQLQQQQNMSVLPPPAGSAQKTFDWGATFGSGSEGRHSQPTQQQTPASSVDANDDVTRSLDTTDASTGSLKLQRTDSGQSLSDAVGAGIGGLGSSANSGQNWLEFLNAITQSSSSSSPSPVHTSLGGSAWNVGSQPPPNSTSTGITLPSLNAAGMGFSGPSNSLASSSSSPPPQQHLHQHSTGSLPFSQQQPQHHRDGRQPPMTIALSPPIANRMPSHTSSVSTVGSSPGRAGGNAQHMKRSRSDSYDVRSASDGPLEMGTYASNNGVGRGETDRPEDILASLGRLGTGAGGRRSMSGDGPPSSGWSGIDGIAGDFDERAMKRTRV